MHPILEKLKGGDRRSIGRANEVVRQVLRNPALLGELFKGMRSGDPLVRMRAADAAEKVTAQRPDMLQRYKRSLLHTIANIDQQEVRWHVAQMIPRLNLTPTERVRAIGILFAYLSLKSKIVRTFALQALGSLSYNDSDLRRRVIKLLKEIVETGSPALKARGRKLLEQLRRAAS
jgi:HEAT repeat protein